jgi:hypothetical protein
MREEKLNEGIIGIKLIILTTQVTPYTEVNSLLTSMLPPPKLLS